MISYKKALSILENSKINIKDEKILSTESKNKISSKNVYSPCNYPSANNTAFDGFAINSKETIGLNRKKQKKFKILKVLAAGDNPRISKIKKFSTIEVMTGALINRPFDTVIPIEKVKYYPNNKNPKYIIIREKIKKNNNIRKLGSDFKKGDKLISKGQIIKSSHIMALKTLGINQVLVKKNINISFYSTGNEISNNKKIKKWKVRNSNSHYLKSLLKNFPINFVEKKILRDNDLIKFNKEIKKKINSKTDLIITSGAVSAGKFDFIPKVIFNYKISKFFKGVAVRPGKPVMFAKFKNKNKVFFGLPGNPISSAACFRFFVIPFIFLSTKVEVINPFSAKLKKNFVKKKKFTRFIKGRLKVSKKGLVEFDVLKGQESFRINPFTKSNCWGIFPNGISNFKKGAIISCYTSLPWEELFLN